MSGIKHYFPDDLIGTDLSLRTHLDDEGDLWVAILEDGDTMESVLLTKEEAGKRPGRWLKFFEPTPNHEPLSLQVQILRWPANPGRATREHA